MTASPSSRFAILLDGSLTPTDRLRAQMSGRRVLAADGGIRYADALGATPELWLGDFDSAEPALLERFSGVAREDYPSEKSISDGQIAIEHALKQGATHILLAGALGGPRSDHAMFNLAAAASLVQRRPDLDLVLTSGREEAIPLVPGKPLSPDWPEGTIFSVVGFNEMKGLTVRNAKWPLDCVEVPFGSTWTLSNLAGEQMQILLSTGCGIAICQLDLSVNEM